MASTNGLVKTVRNQESSTTKHENKSLITQQLLHTINLHYKYIQNLQSHNEQVYKKIQQRKCKKV